MFSCNIAFDVRGYYWNRERGVTIKNVDAMSGEVTVNLNEELFLHKTADSSTKASLDSSSNKSQKNQNAIQAFKKHALGLPEKVRNLGI